MAKYFLYILPSLVAVLLLAGSTACSGQVEAQLDEQFSLPAGESIMINGEDLEIRFVEVSEDSRCPKDVTCIWAGRVTAVVEISRGGPSEQLSLSQPGLTGAPARQTYQEYELAYGVEPYPEKAEVGITADEYRLLLTVSR